MPKKCIKFDRDFQVWRFEVGHGRLLLRSTKGPFSNSRIDLFFKNVSFINIPTVLKGVSLVVADESELQAITGTFTALIQKDSKLYIINNYFHIVAGYFEYHEDDLEYYDASYFDV